MKQRPMPGLALLMVPALLAGCAGISIGIGVPIGRVNVGVGGTLRVPERADSPASAPAPAASAALSAVR